jgi:hypothetical protein
VPATSRSLVASSSSDDCEGLLQFFFVHSVESGPDPAWQ